LVWPGRGRRVRASQPREARTARKGAKMVNKIIVLSKDGQWVEMENCFLVGAIEYPDKVVYHKFLFCRCEEETRNEILRRAEEYLIDLEKERD
jgi:hypothetical protein